MVKTRDPTCCRDILNTEGSSEEMLFSMVAGGEGGVAVVKNDSNKEQTPYISFKETLNPTTE